MMSSAIAERIRTCEGELALHEPIFFRRYSLSNGPVFRDFVQSLQSNRNITSVIWRPRFSNNLTPEQRQQVFRLLGRMHRLVKLDLGAPLTDASPLGEAVVARHLKILKINTTMSLRFDETAQEGLAGALQGHPSLEELECVFASHAETALDPVLVACASCPNLQKMHMTTAHVVSGAAIQELVRSAPQLTDLHFSTVLSRNLSWDFPAAVDCHWGYIAQELQYQQALPPARRRTSSASSTGFRRRRSSAASTTSTCSNTSGGNNLPSVVGLQRLSLVTAVANADTLTGQCRELANALRYNTRLHELILESTAGFADEAVVALADACKTNTTLRMLRMQGQDWRGSTFQLGSANTKGAAYKALEEMLMENHKLTVIVGKPALPANAAAAAAAGGGAAAAGNGNANNNNNNAAEQEEQRQQRQQQAARRKLLQKHQTWYRRLVLQQMINETGRDHLLGGARRGSCHYEGEQRHASVKSWVRALIKANTWRMPDEFKWAIGLDEAETNDEGRQQEQQDNTNGSNQQHQNGTKPDATTAATTTTTTTTSPAMDLMLTECLYYFVKEQPLVFLSRDR